MEIVKSGTELPVLSTDLALTSVAEWPATQTLVNEVDGGIACRVCS